MIDLLIAAAIAQILLAIAVFAAAAGAHQSRRRAINAARVAEDAAVSARHAANTSARWQG